MSVGCAFLIDGGLQSLPVHFDIPTTLGPLFRHFAKTSKPKSVTPLHANFEQQTRRYGGLVLGKSAAGGGLFSMKRRGNSRRKQVFRRITCTTIVNQLKMVFDEAVPSCQACWCRAHEARGRYTAQFQSIHGGVVGKVLEQQLVQRSQADREVGVWECCVQCILETWYGN